LPLEHTYWSLSVALRLHFPSAVLDAVRNWERQVFKGLTRLTVGLCATVTFISSIFISSPRFISSVSRNRGFVCRLSSRSPGRSGSFMGGTVLNKGLALSSELRFVRIGPGITKSTFTITDFRLKAVATIKCTALVSKAQLKIKSDSFYRLEGRIVF